MLSIFRDLGGYYTSCSILVAIALTRYNNKKYERKVSRNIKDKFPEVYSNVEVEEIERNIPKTLTPENNYHLFFEMLNQKKINEEMIKDKELI